MIAARILITFSFLLLIISSAQAHFLRHWGYHKLSLPPIVKLEMDKHRCQSPCQVNFKVKSLMPSFFGQQISHYVFIPGDGSGEIQMVPAEFSYTYEFYGEEGSSGKHGRHKKQNKNKREFKNFKPQVYAVSTSGVRGPRSKRLLRVKAGTPPINNIAPVASFEGPSGAYQNDNLTFISTASDSDGTIVREDWTISDGRTLQGHQVELSFAASGSYQIILTVTDNNGASTSYSQNIEIFTTPNESESPVFELSAGTIAFSGINEYSFNPRQIELTASLSDALFNTSVNLTNVYLNQGGAIHASQVSSSEAVFNFTALDGKNELTLEAIDSEGLPIRQTLVFYAGEHSIILKAQEQDGSFWNGAGEVSVVLNDDERVTSVANMVNGSAQVDNLPSTGLFATVKTEGGGFGISNIEAITDEFAVTLLPRRAASSIDNDDFSQGLAGWDIVGGSAELVSHEEEGVVDHNDQDVALTVAAGQSARLGRSIVIREEANAFEVKFSAQLLSDQTKATVILRNETTNEVRFLRLNNKNRGNLGDWFYHAIAAHAGDLVHYDVILQRDPQATSWLDKIGLVSHAWADDADLDRFMTGEVRSSRDSIIEAKASSWYHTWNKLEGRYITNYRVFDGSLRYLSVGSYTGAPTGDENSIYMQIIPTDEAFANTSEITRIELELSQTVDGRAVRVLLNAAGLPATNPSLYRYLSSATEYQKLFNLSTNQALSFFTEDRYLISTRLIVTTGSGERKPYPIRNAATLIPLLWHNVGSRYGEITRDEPVKGDSWSLQSVANILSGDSAAADDGAWHTGMSSLGFAYNDISKLNGGKFDPHHEHQGGRDVDFAVNDLFVTDNSSRPKILHLNSTGVKKLADAFTSIENQRFGERVEKILGAYSRDESNYTTGAKVVGSSSYRKYSTDMYKHIRAKCSNDYRLLPDIMRNEPDHYTHLHARFYKEGEGVRALSVANPQDFLLSFRHIDEADGSMVLEVQPNEAGWNKYFWEIYQVNVDGLELIDVIDDKHTLGATADMPENYPSVRAISVDDYNNPRVITYRFTPGQEYVISLVGVQRNGEGLSFNADEASVDRCVRKQYRFTAPRTLVCGGAPVFLSQNDQVRPAPVGSLHQNYAGVFKGDNVSVDENALIQSDGAARLCAGTIIEGSGGTSGTLAGSVVGEEEIKPALRMAGEVELANTHVDLNDGRLVLAGQEDILGLPQPNDPDFYNQYVVNRTLIQNSVIRPTQDREIGIVNSWIWGNSLITDDADIQTSAITNSEVRDNAFVGGTTVTAVQEASEEGRIARVTIAGTSIVYGAVYTLDNLLIENSGLADKSRVSGQVSIRDSVIDGMVSADENIVGEGERVAEITAKSYIGPKGSLSGRVYMNQGGLDAGDESPDRLPSVAGGSASIYQATLNDGASVEGNTELLGSRILFRNSSAWDNASFNSEACDGTGSFLDVNGNSIVFGSARMCGTATISGVHMFDTATVNDNAQVFFSRVQHNGSISGKATVVGNSLDSMLQVGGNAKVLGEAVVTGFSSITGTANLFGTVRVHNCRLINGFYGSGNINPTMENSPCLNASSSMATLAFAAQTIGADTSMLVDSSNEEVSDSSLSAMEFQASTVEMKAQQAKKPINKKLLQRYASHLREEARRIASIREARISKNVAKLGRARSSSQKKMSVESFDRMRDGYRQHARQRMQEMRDQAEIYRSYMKVKQD